MERRLFVTTMGILLRRWSGRFGLLFLIVTALSLTAACSQSPPPTPTTDIEATVQAEVARLMLAPRPIPTPDVQATVQAMVRATTEAEATPTPIPTPVVQATVWAEIRTPTPKSPSLTAEQVRQRYRDERSASLSGQRTLYEQKMAADPYAATANPTTRATLERQFPRLAAGYALWNIANPSSRLDFRDYVDRHGYFGITERQVHPVLKDLGLRGILPRKGESLVEYQQNRTADPWRHVRVRLFADDEQMANLMRVALRAEVSTPFQSGSDRVLDRAIAAFRDENLTKPLFSEFIDRGMKWW